MNLPNEILSLILNYVISDYIVHSNQTKRICFMTKASNYNCACFMINLSKVNQQWRNILHDKCIWNKCGWSFKNKIII